MYLKEATKVCRDESRENNNKTVLYQIYLHRSLQSINYSSRIAKYIKVYNTVNGVNIYSSIFSILCMQTGFKYYIIHNQLRIVLHTCRFKTKRYYSHNLILRSSIYITSFTTN